MEHMESERRTSERYNEIYEKKYLGTIANVKTFEHKAQFDTCWRASSTFVRNTSLE